MSVRKKMLIESHPALMTGRLLWRGSTQLTCRLVQRCELTRNRLMHLAALRCNPAVQRLAIVSPTEQATQQLASLLAERATVGDCFCLYGDVGVGKSVFR